MAFHIIIMFDPFWHQLLLSESKVLACTIFKLAVCSWCVPGSLRLPSFHTECVCASTPKAVNYIYVILNLYNKLSKFAM